MTVSCSYFYPLLNLFQLCSFLTRKNGRGTKFLNYFSTFSVFAKDIILVIFLTGLVPVSFSCQPYTISRSSCREYSKYCLVDSNIFVLLSGVILQSNVEVYFSLKINIFDIVFFNIYALSQAQCTTNNKELATNP